jgi:hypothetical protein
MIEYLIFAWWFSLPPSACMLREYLRSRGYGRNSMRLRGG